MVQQIVNTNPSSVDAVTKSEKTLDLLNEEGVQSVKASKENPAVLIDWHVGVLRAILEKIATRRQTTWTPPSSSSVPYEPQQNGTVVDEIVEIIELPPQQHSSYSHYGNNHYSTKLSDVVERQLHNFVASIADMYRANPFHNFQHASRVTKSLELFLSRIASAAEPQMDSFTYRLTSDPVTHFACIFAALIHDVDHSGVPNCRLVQEQSPLASTYDNKSVAEQNSVDLAWNLLMQDKFQDLRGVIYTNEQELQQFRQIVVNAVMATDIMDKDLKVLRNSRWSKAFDDDIANEEQVASSQSHINRKVTSIIEHLIQASDVAHTMDKWESFREWNACLFEEMSRAFEEGRADRDPAHGWYKGEIGFFDFYIIPLAKKLRDSGIFGSHGEEFVRNAENNRYLWEAHGRVIVADMVIHRMKYPLHKNVSRPAAA